MAIAARAISDTMPIAAPAVKRICRCNSAAARRRTGTPPRHGRRPNQAGFMVELGNRQAPLPGHERQPRPEQDVDPEEASAGP